MLLALASSLMGDAASGLREEVVALPVTCWTWWGDTYESPMNVTVFRPAGEGPFPLVVFSHGAGGGDGLARFEEPSRRFVEKGFVVLVPSRVGNGILNLDLGAAQVLAAMDYGRSLPDIDSRRILLVGWEWGGFLAIGLAAGDPPGVLAAVNLGGGFGGLSEMWLHRDQGRRTRVPTLWIYAQNGRPFPAAYGRAWATAFADAGGQVDFRLLPASGEDGPGRFPEGSGLWMPLVEDFLRRAGF
ncbi:MAG TPA: hypothetical protein PLA48_03605 [Holophaga sp.]|nr:hypothetical protein [Holophaga sp.]